MEGTMADPHLVRLRLQRRLAAVAVRQQQALRRNRVLLWEFLQLGAHMDTGWHRFRKMEWYGKEIKRLLSLGEGSLSAGGDKEEGCSKQVLQAGAGPRTAVPGELGHPAAALLGCPTAAASAPGDLGSQQGPPPCSPSLEGLGPGPGSAAGESEEGAAGHGHLAASEEGSEQLPSASGDRAAPPRQGQQQGSVPGAQPGLSSWRPCREGSSAHAQEEARPSIPSTGQELGRDAQAPEGSLLPPPSPPTAQEEPLDSSASLRSGGLLAEPLELCRALQLLEHLVESTSPRHQALYQGQPSGTAQLPRLAQGDLREMEAVVLQQLQAVSQNPGHQEYTRDTEELRTLLSDHGLFLKQHQVQLPEEVAEMFEQLLALREEQDGQAVPVLREALPGGCGDEPPVQSDESSLCLPSIPTNGGDRKQGDLAWREPGGDHSHSSPKGSNSLGMHSDSSSLSDGSAAPFSRTELRKEAVPAIKSKAFWGESDDSSSELEAALHPQTNGADSDDFNDFYD